MAEQPRTSRRGFLRGVAGLAAGGLVLPSRAEATPPSGELGSYGVYLARQGESADQVPAGADPGVTPGAGSLSGPTEWRATQENILGPFYRQGAPFRGKVTPPLEPGVVLQITGRVWALDTRRPLPTAVLDIWQANADGRYDNDDPRNPPAADVFVNRCRLAVDEQGGYACETIHPGAYRIGRRQWRPPHIHYLVRAPGYRPLVTQLYFRGDDHQDTDPFILPSLIIDLESEQTVGGTYRRGVFDIVLERG
jgi:catechol 1,2-dioxygenase